MEKAVKVKQLLLMDRLLRSFVARKDIILEGLLRLSS